MISPATEYANRKEARQKERAQRERVHRRIGGLKVLAIAAGLLLAWLCLVRDAISGYWLLAPVGAYLVLAVWHELTLRRRSRAEHAAAFCERGLARIEDRWSGTGATGERFRDAKHIYAEDLDLFGKGGLFQLLSSAQTAMGEERLAQWLLRPAPVEEIRERQKSVSALREELDLREEVALLGAELEGTLEPKQMDAWAEGETKLANQGLRALASGLAILEMAAIVWWAVRGEYAPFLVVLTVNACVYAWLWRRAEWAVSGVGANEDGLLIFSKILALIEQRKFGSGRREDFQGGRRNESGGSRAVKQLAQIVNWIDARDSLFVKILELPLLYTIQTGLAADRWRKKHRGQMREWLDAAAEFEALLSISAYAYEHPADPFPEFVDAADGQAIFSGRELGHPLIAAARCVRNSVHLGADTRVLLVSGSNMSGKSTLLRTVGVNFILAMAGAPVRAETLRLSPMALGARIRSTDSLQEARSNFYTEILRIRQVAAMAEQETRVLFLFDELLEGTNSHDRQIGAEGLLHAFVERGAIGIITTHDLALTRMGSLDGNVRNVHFEDQIVEGEMVFDYRLREGVVPKSNALDLMRWIGLKV